jgi:hypothetical protein
MILGGRGFFHPQEISAGRENCGVNDVMEFNEGN